MPGYGPYGYGPPSPALGYITAVAFLVCGVMSLMFAISGFDGTGDNVQMLLAMIGVVFKDEVSGNFDYAVAITMSVACTTICLALVMFARLEFVRWVLVALGGLVAVYYLYAVIWILSNDGGEWIALALVTWLLWTAATIVAALPATGRAMRRRNRFPQPGFPQPGYPQQY